MSLKDYFDTEDLYVFILTFAVLTFLINQALVSGFITFRLCETGCGSFVKRWARIMLFPQLLILPALFSGLTVFAYRKLRDHSQ